MAKYIVGNPELDSQIEKSEQIYLKLDQHVRECAQCRSSCGITEDKVEWDDAFALLDETSARNMCKTGVQIQSQYHESERAELAILKKTSKKRAA